MSGISIFPAMRSFLLQPYPFSENAARKIFVCGGVGLFIIFFLSVFEPFGFDNLPESLKWQHAFFFGAVTFIISSFFQIILPKIFPNWFREEAWRSWKEIVYLLLTTAFIGAGNYGLILYLYPQNTTLSGLLKAELITLQIGIFPIVFIVFMKQVMLFKRFAADAKQATDDIEAENTVEEQPVAPVEIFLRGDNQREELNLLPGELLFISSADNYVNIRYLQAGKQKSMLMRSSLKKMEDQLTGLSYFFRCHRMYIINLHRVINVSGNAQGLKLHLDGSNEALPVSRSLTEAVKEKLHQLSHSPQHA
jgi:hypothetical protein